MHERDTTGSDLDLCFCERLSTGFFFECMPCVEDAVVGLYGIWDGFSYAGMGWLHVYKQATV